MTGRARRTVMVVDDNLEMARTIADGLAERGYDALAAGSGRQVLERLENGRVDAIVTDLAITERQKQVLLDIYASFLQQNEAVQKEIASD